MKPKKLTSLMVMLLLALNATGQEQFFDDVYYSSNQSKEEASVEKNIKEEEKNDDLDAEPTETVSPSSYTRSDIEEERDVDEYNRRYSGYDDEAYAEEEEVAQEPEKTQVKVESDRRSDLEYSERIIRYHSPSKISIVGADQVDLYLEDGYYAYEVDGVEVLCKTNIWDYIDGDVWHRTEMFEDLGYERDDSIEVASRSPGFFRYTEEGRLDALLGAPMNKNSEDFLELRYLNVLGFYGQGGRFVEIIIRYYQDGFATDEPDGPTTPIDLVIMSAYFLEQCQENVDNDYLYVFPNAGDGVYRIYE